MSLGFKLEVAFFAISSVIVFQGPFDIDWVRLMALD